MLLKNKNLLRDYNSLIFTNSFYKICLILLKNYFYSYLLPVPRRGIKYASNFFGYKFFYLVLPKLNPRPITKIFNRINFLKKYKYSVKAFREKS